MIQEGHSPSGQRRRKASKRLQVVEAFSPQREQAGMDDFNRLAGIASRPQTLPCNFDGGRFANQRHQ